MRKLFIYLIAVTLLSASACFAESEDGGYAGVFTTMGVGARPLGLGGAFTGLCDDVNSGYWNPAGVTTVEEFTVGGMYRKLDLDRRYNFFNFVTPITGDASLGLSWVNAGVGDVQGRDSDGLPTEEIKNRNNAISLSFARRLIDREPIEMLSLGVNIKYIQEDLSNINAYGVGFDFGAFARITEEYAVGFAVQNIGSRYNWDSGDYYATYGSQGTTYKETFPVNFRLGASGLFLDKHLVLASDIEKNNKQEMRLHVGGEYWLFREVLREVEYEEDREEAEVRLLVKDRWVGIRAGYDDGRFAFGGSVWQEVKWFDVGLGYAFVTAKVDESPEHVVSIELQF
jgi:hypothetical protein